MHSHYVERYIRLFSVRRGETRRSVATWAHNPLSESVQVVAKRSPQMTPDGRLTHPEWRSEQITGMTRQQARAAARVLPRTDGAKITVVHGTLPTVYSGTAGTPHPLGGKAHQVRAPKSCEPATPPKLRRFPRIGIGERSPMYRAARAARRQLIRKVGVKGRDGNEAKIIVATPIASPWYAVRAVISQLNARGLAKHAASKGKIGQRKLKRKNRTASIDHMLGHLYGGAE